MKILAVRITVKGRVNNRGCRLPKWIGDARTPIWSDVPGYRWNEQTETTQVSRQPLRPQFSGKNYAAIVNDPNGHSIEVVCHESD
jgi:hypothetical protein